MEDSKDKHETDMLLHRIHGSSADDRPASHFARAMEVFRNECIGESFLKANAFGRTWYKKKEIYLEPEEFSDIDFIMFLADYLNQKNFKCEVIWRSQVEHIKKGREFHGKESKSKLFVYSDSLKKASRMTVCPCNKGETPSVIHFAELEVVPSETPPSTGSLGSCCLQ